MDFGTVLCRQNNCGLRMLVKLWDVLIASTDCFIVWHFSVPRQSIAAGGGDVRIKFPDRVNYVDEHRNESQKSRTTVLRLISLCDFAQIRLFLESVWFRASVFAREGIMCFLQSNPDGSPDTSVLKNRIRDMKNSENPVPNKDVFDQHIHPTQS
uniref:Rab-GAP TBC domain-containing protein n=1 Tax=Globodera rostochiensis TaxID=31243 RepID=A0A914HXF3_GLORO